MTKKSNPGRKPQFDLCHEKVRGGRLADWVTKSVTSQTQAILRVLLTKQGKQVKARKTVISKWAQSLSELLRVYVLKGGQLRLELRNFVCLRFNVAWFGD